MNYKKIYFSIILIVIAIFLLGFAFSAQTKQDSMINITSDKTLNNQDNFTVKLTDLNGKAISNQEINITFNASNGTQINKTVKTNESGEANLKLEGMGAQKYDVVVSFAGNDDYNGCNATQSLEIKDNGSSSSTSDSRSVSTQTTGSSSDNQNNQNNLGESGSNSPDEDSSSKNNLVSVNSPLGANPLFA